jgi:agmatinase
MRTLGINSNFLSIEKKYSDFDNSKIAILSAPYEKTTSYGKGTSKGPKEILKASAFVEFYDDEFDRELCNEIGITSIYPLNLNDKTPETALNTIESKVTELLNHQKFVVTVGGEHTISYAPIKAHFIKFPDMSILDFDAHSDLRDKYDDSNFSHACVMKRVCDFFPSIKITQVGIRAQSIEEAHFIKNNHINTFYASKIRTGAYGKNWQKTVADSLGKEIYVTFDIDYFDPSLIPATGTPEPDGFMYSETIDIFREIIRQKKRIIGFDVVELAPVKNLHHPNLITARLIYKMLNFAFANQK